MAIQDGQWPVIGSHTNSATQTHDGHVFGKHFLDMREALDFSSFVPDPVTMSSAEAEVNTVTIAIMSDMQVRMIHKELTHGNRSKHLTIPF